MDLYMVGMGLCHIPTLRHGHIFPPGGDMNGGNMLVGHDESLIMMMMVTMMMMMMMMMMMLMMVMMMVMMMIQVIRVLWDGLKGRMTAPPRKDFVFN